MKKMYSPRDFDTKSRTQCHKCFFKKHIEAFVLFFTHKKESVSEKISDLLIFLHFKKERVREKPQTGPIYLSENNMRRKNKIQKKELKKKGETKKKWQKRSIFALKLSGILFAIGLLGVIGVSAFLLKIYLNQGK